MEKHFDSEQLPFSSSDTLSSNAFKAVSVFCRWAEVSLCSRDFSSSSSATLLRSCRSRSPSRRCSISRRSLGSAAYDTLARSWCFRAKQGGKLSFLKQKLGNAGMLPAQSRGVRSLSSPESIEKVLVFSICCYQHWSLTRPETKGHFC